ncbi:unnamed protein product [Musa banksii]
MLIQDINEWPIIDPLPSYGRGRDAVGGRYSNLIMGYNLTDVVITGRNNGTIDGQGETWWKMFRNKELNYTRGYLIELMYCKQVLISNITLVNSPSWNVHPVYSSHVIVSGITILAPVNSPNTDGIDPDSSSNVRIEDCYIVSGDDCIAIKSGWDEYGIAFNMSSKHIVIRRLTCISPRALSSPWEARCREESKMSGPKTSRPSTRIRRQDQDDHRKGSLREGHIREKNESAHNEVGLLDDGHLRAAPGRQI